MGMVLFAFIPISFYSTTMNKAFMVIFSIGFGMQTCFLKDNHI